MRSAGCPLTVCLSLRVYVSLPLSWFVCVCGLFRCSFTNCTTPEKPLTRAMDPKGPVVCLPLKGRTNNRTCCCLPLKGCIHATARKVLLFVCPFRAFAWKQRIFVCASLCQRLMLRVFCVGLGFHLHHTLLMLFCLQTSQAPALTGRCWH